jgi:hypothetical protein
VRTLEILRNAGTPMADMFKVAFGTFVIIQIQSTSELLKEQNMQLKENCQQIDAGS